MPEAKQRKQAMKKVMMMILVMAAALVANADFTFMQVYSAMELTASNQLQNASADVKKKAKEAMETAKQMQKDYKTSGLGNYTVSNANHVVSARYVRGKKIYFDVPWFGSEARATARAIDDMMLRGIEAEKNKDVQLELLIQYKVEKFDL